MMPTIKDDKDALLDVLDDLSEEQVADVYMFALFIKSHAIRQQRQPMTIKTVPASRLQALAGLVSWGGDALSDTEHVYD